MDRIREYFIRWNFAFSDMVMALFLFSFLQVGKAVAFTSLIPYVLAFSAMLVLDMFMVEKEAGLVVYVIINGLAAMALSLLQQPFLYLGIDTVGMRILYFFIVMIPFVHGAVAAPGKLERKTAVSYFDFLVILEVLFIATLGTAASLPPVLATLGVIALVGMQAVLVSFRLKTNDQGSRGKRIAGAVAMGVAIAFICLLSFLLSKGFGIASTAFVDGMGWLMRNFYRILMAVLTAFFDWLLALLPDADRYELPEVDEGVAFDPRVTEVSEGNPALFIGMMVVLLAAVIVFFLFKLRGKRLKKNAKAGTVAKRRRKSRVSMGLGRLWKRICIEVKFRISYMVHRNSASGLFVWTERFYHRRGAGRMKSETPSVYLRRIASSVAPEEARKDMLLLSDKLDEEYYGGRKAELPPAFHRGYRKENKALRLTLRQYFEIRRRQRLMAL